MNEFKKFRPIQDVKYCLIEGIPNELGFEVVADFFSHIANGKDKKDFYVGITNDPDRREDEHNANFLGLVKCKSEAEAKELETELNGKGFDTGSRPANGGKKDTKFVYVYKKTSKTVE